MKGRERGKMRREKERSLFGWKKGGEGYSETIKGLLKTMKGLRSGFRVQGHERRNEEE